MTIVEEIDKISGRTKRSKNIQDAVDYLAGVAGGSQNISAAIHRYDPEEEPTGSIEITTNGEHNVKAYATAVVDVPAIVGSAEVGE